MFPLNNSAHKGLTHCGPVMLYGDIDLGQHWLRWWLAAWRHQASTWTNDYLSSATARPSEIHLGAISHEIPQQSVAEFSLEITYLKFHSNLPGAGDLNDVTFFAPLSVLEIPPSSMECLMAMRLAGCPTSLLSACLPRFCLTNSAKPAQMILISMTKKWTRFCIRYAG